MEALMVLEQVTKTYNQGKPNALNALDGLSLTIGAGEMTAVMGRSGAGKSTLLHILGCLDTVTSGSYTLAGEEVGGLSDKRLSKIRNEKVGILLQDFALIPPQSALQNCMTPLYFNKTPMRAMKKQALEALARVGMEAFCHQAVGTMSGGQQQRVAMARALISKPAVILCDEPTGALDSTTAEEVIGQLAAINKEGTTIIIVTHDAQVAAACGRTIRLSDGRLESTADAPDSGKDR